PPSLFVRIPNGPHFNPVPSFPSPSVPPNLLLKQSNEPVNPAPNAKINLLRRHERHRVPPIRTLASTLYLRPVFTSVPFGRPGSEPQQTQQRIDERRQTLGLVDSLAGQHQRLLPPAFSLFALAHRTFRPVRRSARSEHRVGIRIRTQTTLWARGWVPTGIRAREQLQKALAPGAGDAADGNALFRQRVLEGGEEAGRYVEVVVFGRGLGPVLWLGERRRVVGSASVSQEQVGDAGEREDGEVVVCDNKLYGRRRRRRRLSLR
ncbi:MAG: hypothetical protein LQ340_008088, partial [Diploschistes diacapsis]